MPDENLLLWIDWIHRCTSLQDGDFSDVWAWARSAEEKQQSIKCIIYKDYTETGSLEQVKK